MPYLRPFTEISEEFLLNVVAYNPIKEPRTKTFKKNQKITWHNNIESGAIIGTNGAITVKWDTGGTIIYPLVTAEKYIK